MRLALCGLMIVTMVHSTSGMGAEADREIRALVSREVQELLPADRPGGAVVGLRIDGRTFFFSYGTADGERKVTPDSLFNVASVRKVFEAALLAEAVSEGRMRLDDRVADHVTELREGGDISRVTIGELATHTSGLLLPQDHPPWPTQGYTLPRFIRTLNEWRADAEQQPGRQHMYSHAGYVLLQLALERRFRQPIATLLHDRMCGPLRLASTVVPERGNDGRARLPPELMARVVQGYSDSGEPVGAPGDQQTYYEFPGTGQMYSSARDLMTFLTANLGELPVAPPLRQALRSARQGAFRISPHNVQALAWEINENVMPVIIEKNGGMNNASSYVGFMPDAKIAVVILTNRGDQNVAESGRRILSALAHRRV